MRRGSSCCTPAENSQFDGRCPQPVRTSGSYCTAALVEPNEFCATAPHSPLAALLDRSQSGVKFLFASFQVRVVVVCSVRIGFGFVPKPLSVCPRRYLLAASRTAVFPSPRTS